MPVYTVAVNTTGSAGSAAGTGDFPHVDGTITYVQCDWNASAPATSDVTLTEADGALRTLLTKSNSATDAIFYPAAQLQDNAGTSVTFYAPFYVCGRLRVTIAQCDALAPALTVRIGVHE